MDRKTLNTDTIMKHTCIATYISAVNQSSVVVQVSVAGVDGHSGVQVRQCGRVVAQSGVHHRTVEQRGDAAGSHRPQSRHSKGTHNNVSPTRLHAVPRHGLQNIA